MSALHLCALLRKSTVTSEHEAVQYQGPTGKAALKPSTLETVTAGEDKHGKASPPGSQAGDSTVPPCSTSPFLNAETLSDSTGTRLVLC